MEALIVFFGLSSFAITGTDDLLVLILFYIAFKSKFKEVIFGTAWFTRSDGSQFCFCKSYRIFRSWEVYPTRDFAVDSE